MKKIAGTSPLAVALMVAGAIALIAIILMSSWLASTTADLSARVLQARQIRISASEVLETLLNAETGQRGYLLSGNPRYLGPFDSAQATITRDLDRLVTLELGNPVIQGDLNRVRALSTQRMTILNETVALARAAKRDQALALVRTDRGFNIMEETSGILTNVISDSEQTVSTDLATLNSNAKLLRAVSLIGGLLVMLFAGAALWLVVRAVRLAVIARTEVERLNSSLEERVVRRTAALTRANEEIQRFAYIVSHDLRAPLVNIMGFTSELEFGSKALANFFENQNDEANPAAKEAATATLPEAVRFIRSSTAKMDRLINAILKLSREGRRELLGEQVDLNRLFENIIASLKQQADEHQTVFDLPPILPALHSDRLGLEQVFSNILDNAIKYLQPGRQGRINISCETAQNLVVIKVTDNGRGIADQDLERIFELFRRAGRQDRPGEGIGLAHVRALVRRLGGDITIRSRLGEGSEFRVQLPRVLPTEPSSNST